MKRSLIFILIFLAGVLVGPWINPFSMVNELFEEDAVSHVIGKEDTYNGEKVTDVDYLGEGSYFVKTEVNEYILEKRNTSVMNGVWVIYEKFEEGYNW